MVLVEVAKHPNKAAQKPNTLKLSSVIEVRRIPPTMGTNEAQIRQSKYFLHTNHCNTTALTQKKKKTIRTEHKRSLCFLLRKSSKKTCCSWSEGFDCLHERDRDVSKADVSQHNVDTEDEWHWEDPLPSVFWINHDQRLNLEDFDHNVCSDRWTYEMNAWNRQWKLEIQFL